MNRLGVLGWPVAHSLSPAIQTAALRAAGLGDQWRYQLLPVPPTLFAGTVRALASCGFRGANVTIPHKAAALAIATAASERARAIGAANTLLFRQEGEIWAENTDAPAFSCALRRLNLQQPASALVLGAGGSARATIRALLDTGAAEVTVWNRTAARAAALADEFGVSTVSDPAQAAGAELIVNCTSVGLHQDDGVDALPMSVGQLRHHRAAVDWVYRQAGTPFIAAAAAAGLATVDGLELLIGQGAIAFELFTGVEASIEAMRRAIGLSSPG